MIPPTKADALRHGAVLIHNDDPEDATDDAEDATDDDGATACYDNNHFYVSTLHEPVKKGWYVPLEHHESMPDDVVRVVRVSSLESVRGHPPFSSRAELGT
jgi:hypothetical protein